MPSGEDPRCPVCRARFRGLAACPRCGADLAPLMRLEVRSWALRRQASAALKHAEFDKALRLAEEAQRLRRSERGRRLAVLGRWLAE